MNLFGHVAMMQALLPALIESRGRIVNVSSLGGKVAMATYGPYAGSKFALEAVSDALRREVVPLGVKGHAAVRNVGTRAWRDQALGLGRRRALQAHGELRWSRSPSRSTSPTRH